MVLLTQDALNELMMLDFGYKENTIRALYAFWMSHSDRKTSEYALDRLKESFPDLIKTIGGCSSMVDQLNQFIANEAQHPKTPQILFDSESQYHSKDNIIVIGQGEQLWSNVNDETVISLAHEVAHSISIIGAGKKTTDGYIDPAKCSLMEYVDLMNKAEGEAIYYEFVAQQSIYGDKKESRRDAWLYGAISMAKQHNFFADISRIMDADITKDKKIERLGNEINSQILAFNLERLYWDPDNINANVASVHVALTYDDYYKLVWLFNQTDLAIDYLEALGISGYARGDADAGNAAIKKILESPDGGFNLKVLVNQINKYIGSGGNDILSAKENGSILGQLTQFESITRGENGEPDLIERVDKDQYEVLWGGGGDDVLHGSNVKDILLGGDDNDKLYGYGSDDTLAGNQGNDILYGGAGADHLYGGTEHDRLYGGEGDDTYHFDLTNEVRVAPDLIHDAGGIGKIIVYTQGNFGIVRENTLGVDGITREQGMPENTFIDGQERDIWYRFQPSTDSGTTGSLFVYYKNTLVTVIKNFDKSRGSYLGLTLTDNTQALGEISVGGFDATKGRDINIAASGDANKMITVDLSAGDQPDYVRGSDSGEKVLLGGGNDCIEAGGGSDIIYGGSGCDLIIAGPDSGTGDHDQVYGGADRDMIFGGAGDDILMGGAVISGIATI